MEENIFFEKFKSKTNTELQRILENADHYDPQAVQAAAYLLNQRNEEGWEEPSVKTVSVDVKATRVRNKQKPVSHSFIKEYNLRDFWSFLSLVFSLMAITELLVYYRSEPIFEDLSTNYTILGLTPIWLFLGHTLYRHDHKKSNNYQGRVIQDLIFILGFFILKSTYNLLIGKNTWGVSMGDFLQLLLVAFIVLLIFEFLIWILKETLWTLKLDIL